MSQYSNEPKDMNLQYPVLISILLLLDSGYNQREIADKLNLSHKAVKGRLWYAKKRYGCKTNKELVELYFTTHIRK